MYRINEFSSRNISKAIKAKKNVILPLGAIEAHSDHLPLATDNILVEDYTQKLAKLTDSLLLPVLPYGQVWSLSEAPGSINIKEETLVNYIIDIIESLDKNGARMVTLVSSHFGNVNVMKSVAREVYERLPIKVVFFTYPGISEVKNLFKNLNNHHFFLHACEVETSMMLHVAPKYVDMSLIKEGTMHIPPEVDYTPTKWTDFSDTYIMGDAHLATAEKGAQAFKHIIEKAAEIINIEKAKL